MSIESVMPSNHLVLYHPRLLLPSIFPSIKVFSSESVLRIRWPNIGISASASVLPMNIQDWFPLGWTGWISLQSMECFQVVSTYTLSPMSSTVGPLCVWRFCKCGFKQLLIENIFLLSSWFLFLLLFSFFRKYFLKISRKFQNQLEFALHWQLFT